MRKFFEKTKGSISVFLILVLMPMYTCVYLAVDTARYTAAETKINGAMGLTGNAVLADYDEGLKELYGIFAMSQDGASLSEDLSAYFSNMIDTTELPLMSDSYVQVLLNRVISGIAAGGNVGGFENAVYTETAEFSAEYVPESTLVSTEILGSEIRSFMKYRAPLKVAAGTAQNLAAFVDVSKLAGIFKQVSALYSDLSPAEAVLKAVFDSFPRTDETNIENIKNGLTDAFNAIPQLEEVLVPVSKSTDLLEDAMEELDDGETKSMLQDELGDITSIFSTESLDALSLSLKTDLEKLSLLEGTSENAQIVISNLSYRDNPLYKFLIDTYGESGDTVSKETADNAASNIQRIAKFNLSDLYAICNEECTFEVSGLIQHSVWEALYKNVVTPLESTESEITPQGSDFDAYTNNFALLEGIFSDMETYAKTLTQNIYEAEYFTEMFACLITTDAYENLSGVRYGNRNYLIGETEYIIFGKDWMADNITKSVNNIFAIRLLFNSLYAFSNTEMRDAAGTLARAASGVNGLGVFLNQNLLLFAWSMAESVTDVSMLCKGNSVPVYKTAKTWNLDIDSLSKAVTDDVINNQKSSSDALNMTYKDYLKLFALIKMCRGGEKDAMIRRMAGIMQINCAQENVLFDISRCYTKAQLKSSVQVGIHTIEKTKIYGY